MRGMLKALCVIALVGGFAACDGEYVDCPGHDEGWYPPPTEAYQDDEPVDWAMEGSLGGIQTNGGEVHQLDKVTTDKKKVTTTAVKDPEDERETRRPVLENPRAFQDSDPESD